MFCFEDGYSYRYFLTGLHVKIFTLFRRSGGGGCVWGVLLHDTVGNSWLTGWLGRKMNSYPDNKITEYWHRHIYWYISVSFILYKKLHKLPQRVKLFFMLFYFCIFTSFSAMPGCLREMLNDWISLCKEQMCVLLAGHAHISTFMHNLLSKARQILTFGKLVC